MKKYVIDSCIFAKLFLEEEYRQEVLEFFVRANKENHNIIVPTIFSYEFLSIVRYNNIDFDLSYDILHKHLNTIITEVGVSKSIMQEAIRISRVGNNKSGFPSIYDAIYHSLAIKNNCDFITLDHKYYQKVKDIGNIRIFC